MSNPFDEIELDFFMNSGPGGHGGSEAVFAYQVARKDLDGRPVFILNELFRGSKHNVLVKSVEYLREGSGRKDRNQALEFGVGAGRTINFLGGLLSDGVVWGFESGDGFGPTQHYRYTKAIVREVANSDGLLRSKHVIVDVKPVNGSEPDKRDVWLVQRMQLKERVNGEEPFVPFVPLCNVGLVLGDINDTLRPFIHHIAQPGTVDLLFFDLGDPDLTYRILQQCVHLITTGKAVVVADVVLNGPYRSVPPAPMDVPKDMERSGLRIVTQKTDSCSLRFDRFILQPPTGEDKEFKGRVDELLRSESNVLHFNSKNRPIDSSLNDEAKAFAEARRKEGAQPVASDCGMLTYAIAQARAQHEGESRKMLSMEFGFCSGRSLNFIASQLGTGEQLVGFDGGNGLPTDWRYKFPARTFRYLMTWDEKNMRFSYREDDRQRPVLPFTRFNSEQCELRLGLFQQELAGWLRQKPGIFTTHYLGMVFIDSDLRESAETVFGALGHQIIADRTIVVLDEAYNFEGTQYKDRHTRDAFLHYEWKAAGDFARRADCALRCLAINTNGQQVALQFSPLP